MIEFMRELLFFPENLADPLLWGSYHPSGELALHDSIKPSELKAVKALTKKGLTVVLPGQQVASYRFTMPKVTGHAKLQAITFALEGVCSQSIDDIYVIPGDYIDGKQSAMVIDKIYLNDVLLFIKDHNLKVISIVVDYMLLKLPKLSTWELTKLDHDVLWRTDYGTGGRVEESLWPWILEKIFAEESNEPKELVWTLTDKKAAIPKLPDNIKDHCQQTTLQVPSWINKNALDMPTVYQFNVGEYRLRHLFNKGKKTVKRLVWTLIISVVVACVSQAAFTTFIQVKFNKEQQILNQWLTPLGYANMPLDELKRKLIQAIQAAKFVQSQDNYLYDLAAVTKVLTPARMNSLHGLTYNKQLLTLSFPKNIGNDVVKQLQNNMPGYTVTLQPTNKKKPSSFALITVKKVG